MIGILSVAPGSGLGVSSIGASFHRCYEPWHIFHSCIFDRCFYWLLMNLHLYETSAVSRVCVTLDCQGKLDATKLRACLSAPRQTLTLAFLRRDDSGKLHSIVKVGIAPSNQMRTQLK